MTLTASLFLISTFAAAGALEGGYAIGISDPAWGPEVGDMRLDEMLRP